MIFLKYISDSFEDEYSDPEDKDEHISRNVFWVPKEARWEEVMRNAKLPKLMSGQIRVK